MVQRIDIHNEEGIAMTISGVEDIQGKNYLLLSSDSISQIVRNRNPHIQRIEVKKEFPHTVRLIVYFYEPVAYYRVSDTRYLIFASNGSVLEYAYEKPNNIGEIRYYQEITKNDYQIGSVIRLRDVRFASQLARMFVSRGFSQFTIHIEDSNFIQSDLGNAVIIASSNEDEEKQKYAIERVLYILAQNNVSTRSFDVRFQKIILKQ